MDARDKKLLKLSLFVLLVISFPIFSAAYIYGGAKVVVFAVWLFVAAIIQFALIAKTFNWMLDIWSSGFFGTYIDIWIKDLGYKFFLFVSFIGLVLLSVGVWTLLGLTMTPVAEVSGSVSTIPMGEH